MCDSDLTRSAVAELRRLKPDSPVLRFFPRERANIDAEPPRAPAIERAFARLRRAIAAKLRRNNAGGAS